MSLKTRLLFLRMRGVEPGTEMPSHMVPVNSRGKWTTFWIVFTKIHFCACVVFKKRQRCHPTWLPATLRVNGERLGTFLVKVVSAHAPCRKKGQKYHPTWPTPALGVTTERFGVFLPKFLCAHTFCERDTNAIPHGFLPLLGYMVFFHQDGAILVAP